MILSTRLFPTPLFTFLDERLVANCHLSCIVISSRVTILSYFRKKNPYFKPIISETLVLTRVFNHSTGIADSVILLATSLATIPP
jgi:hypothetical protein